MEDGGPPPTSSRGEYKRYLSDADDIPLTSLYRKRRKGKTRPSQDSQDSQESEGASPSRVVGAYLDEEHSSSSEDSDNFYYPSDDSDTEDDQSEPVAASATPSSQEGNTPAIDTPDPQGSPPPTDSFSGSDKERDPRLDHKLSSCEFSRFEILLMVFSFSLRFALSNIAITELCKLLNLILGRCFLPTTSKAFWNVFRSDVSVCVHFYCPQCMLYVGTKEECKLKNCPECGHKLDTKKMNNGHFFITIPIAEQIKRLLEGPEGVKIMNFKKNRQTDNDTLSDIFDGILFHDLDGKVKLTDYDLTLIINTDGSPVFHSGRSALWPILFRINEMEPKERYAPWNTRMSGLWFGKKKINMSTYLTPLVLEMKKLAKHGIEWLNPVTKTIEKSRIFVLNACLDTIAKAPVMNMIQFNGKFGCPYCYHEGNSIPELNNQIRYSHDKTVADRSNESIRDNMQEAQRTGKEVKGMFGPSPLMYLPFFNCCHGFGIDYLHAYMLGVTKYLFCTLWTSQKHEPYYLDSVKVAEMDEQLLNFSPPSHISRDPRSLIQASDYKGNEWRMWLLYYGPICLWGKLPMRYYKHFCRLSSVIYKLLRKSFPKSELPWLHSEMQKFNEEFEELYGINFMTYNVHSTMHLEKAVSMCGPLWTNSAFPFEGGNGFLLNLVTGSNGVPIQIARKYGASISLPDIIREHPKLHDDVIEFYDCMMSHYQPRLKTASSFHGVTVVGNPIQKLFIPTAEEITLLMEMNVPVNDLCWLKRVIYKGFSFASSAIVPQADPSSTESKTKKKDDTLVRLISGILARIQALIFSPSLSGGTVYALLNRINLSPTTCLVPHIKSCRVYLFDRQKLLVPVTEFEAKCMILKRSNTEKFITECFYNFDRD